jgi:hypothetical protein
VVPAAATETRYIRWCVSGDPEGYVEKALEMGISSHRGPVLGNRGEGSSAGDFEMDKGARWMNCLRLSWKSLRGGGLGRSSFTGDARRYFRKVAGCGGPLCCMENRHGGVFVCLWLWWMNEEGL